MSIPFLPIVCELAATPPLLSPAQFAAIELPALSRLTNGYAAAAGRPGALVFAAKEPDGALAEAGRVPAIARGRKRVCIGTGVLPYDADPAIVLQVQTYIQEKS